ncbi:MAG: sterol carrier protein domain-containing protein, partial [Pseudonocardia sp.]|nr:sterol carrier protein domain-containing protein [Pseudonocardia sp.]
ALMRAQLVDTAARGEALAMLGASETGIYGRFGYGVASRTREVSVRTGGGWRTGAPVGGPVRMLAPDEIVSAQAYAHRSIALARVGGMTRPDPWWAPVEERVRAREPVVAIVHTGRDGDDGFAMAVAEPGGTFDDRTLRVLDLHAADVEAAAGLWRFLFGIDLVRRVVAAERPLDEPLDLLLQDPRDLAVTGEEDGTWLRLIDVPAALGARSWAAGDVVLLGVHDRLLPQNAGVYRIGDGGVERVTGVVPELECDVSALAMAYLGDRAPSRLAATGWWSAADPGVLARADRVFATTTVPWCGTRF